MPSVDLMDLRILAAVYETRSVSQSSDKVGLSQPSISIRLGRLRKHFHDPLFVRTAAGMQPTPRADTLLPSIRQALGLFDGTLGQQPAFDPQLSDRSFRICMTDVGQTVIVPKLLGRLKTLAPSVRIEVLNLGAETPRLLESGDADIAMGFTVEIQAGFYQQKLFREHIVCMVSKSHPRIGSHLTRQQFLDEAHVTVVTQRTGHSLLYKALDDQGIRRRIALSVPSFLGLVQIVAHSELLALVPLHLGRILASEGHVKMLPAPIKLPSYLVKQYWHERYHRDAANRWLRSVIAELFLE